MRAGKFWQTAEPREGKRMLRYCAWCGTYQGATAARGHQIRKNVCEIDTTTICRTCLDRLQEVPLERPENHL